MHRIIAGKSDHRCEIGPFCGPSIDGRSPNFRTQTAFDFGRARTCAEIPKFSLEICSLTLTMKHAD